MVGAAGFEPTTPCSQSRCATGLRYAPTGIAKYSIGGRMTQSNFIAILVIRVWDAQ